jgi:hypothetical protein
VLAEEVEALEALGASWDEALRPPVRLHLGVLRHEGVGDNIVLCLQLSDLLLRGTPGSVQ